MDQTDTVRPQHTLRKGVVLALILIFLFLGLMALGISRMLPADTNTVKDHNNATNKGTTQQTDAPAKDTNTPADRTQPSTSGGEANTILNP
jgi:hypothetical protein